MHRAILAAVLSLAAFAVQAAPHKDIAPLAAEAVQAVRAAQQGHPDLLAAALDRHMNEGLEIADRGERSADRITRKVLKAAAASAAVVDRRAEAAAKRQEMLGLKAEALERLDREAQAWQDWGDTARAAQAMELKRKLGLRFDAITQDLHDLAQADEANLGSRAKRLAKRIRDWAAARPVAPLPRPNWQRAEPQPQVDLPKAKSVPRFVSDAYWLMQEHLASRDGFVKVALRATPAEAGACGYTSADLAETAEAPKTNADIVALAQQLDYDPVRMFEWVNQNIAFEPYYGSMKGGLGALWSKSGGATDQASVMIALLRAANIPARYVRGNITVLDNTSLGADGRGPRWIGAKSYLAAATVLASNGNPAAGVYSNGSNQAVGVNLAHVWVEACLPYAAYRGTSLDDSGHRWIPLDPSYKDQRYQAGIAVDGTFDFNYGNWLASRLDAQGRYRLPQEAFEDEVEAHAKTKAPNYANNTLADVPYKSEIKRQHFDILPIVPPYEVRQYTSWSGVAGESAETAALPDRHRYRLLVEVRNKSTTSDPLAGNLLEQKTLNLSELASKRLTLSFKGASTADQDAFDTWFNAVNPAADPTCVATANMVPVLKLEGVEQTMEAGSGTTTLCSTDNVLNMKVTLAELTNPVSKTYYTNIQAANLHALHAWAWHTSDTFLAKRSEQLLANVRANLSNPNADRDGIEGEFLNIAASKYSRYVADASKRAGELFGESGTSGVSLGLTSAQVKVEYLFDLPYGLFRKGFKIDWPGAYYSGTRLDTPNSADRRAFKLSGFVSSAYEAYIWNETANLDAVCTTRGLQFADEQGIEILQVNNATDWANQKCKLTNTCNNGALNTNPTDANYSSADVNQIESQYVNLGYKLTIPRRLIQYPDASGWKGYTFYGERYTPNPSDTACPNVCVSFPIGVYAGGVTVEPTLAATTGSSGSSGGGSGDGTTYGGSALGSALSGSFNAALGTGIIINLSATTWAQLAGINGYQAGNGMSAGTTAAHDPVNMVTGNLIHNERDISIKGRGGLPLVFERYYNSRDAADGPLGFGWTHSLNHVLRFHGVEGGLAKLGWIDGTGGERYFSTANHTSGNIAVGASFTGTPGVYATLARLSGGSYRLTERSGMQYVFETIDAGTADTGLKARLLSITDRNGNALTLSYAATANCPGTYVCQASDGLNRSLTFTYTGSRISQISDWTGRQWHYQYDANGDLVSFKNPLAVSGTQAPVAYQYHTSADGTKLAHALKRYTLPRGNGMRFEYYANGRVFRHTPFGTDGQLKADHATTFAWAAFRREARSIDAKGHERVFLFDANGNPLSITDEAGAETVYTYDQTAGRTHLRLTKRDPMGMVTSYAYDTAGNLTDVTLPSTRTLQTLDHTAFGQPKRVKDADGNWTLNRFDATGRLTDVIRVKAGVTPVADTRPADADILAWSQTQYDTVGNPTKMKRLRDWTTASLGDANTGTGPSLETAWDTNKLNPVSLTRRGDTDGTPASLEVETYADYLHDGLGRQLRGPDAAWYAADSAYDPLDRPIKTPDGRGHQWDAAYDDNGNPVMAGLSVDGAYLDGHYATWDDLDRLERKIDYAGNARLTEYDQLGRTSAVTGADGYRTAFDRDPMGRITGAYDEDGHRVSLTLDADGRPRTRTDPNNLTTAYEYHHAAQDGRLKKTTQPKVTGQTQGKATEIVSYDGAGRPTRINSLAADGTLRDSYRFHDELGRLTRGVGPQTSGADPSRPVTCLVYTPLGDVKEIWAGSTTDTTSKTCVLDGTTIKQQLTRTHDDWGRKLTETDALGHTWRWTWNLHGQLVSSQTPVQAQAGQATSYTYGSKNIAGEVQGQLKTRTVPGAQTVTTTRNPLGQATRVETKNGSNQLVVAYDYGYDPAHRLNTVTDSRGNKTLTYTWTPGGRLAQVADSDGHTASLAYDAVGRLATITAPNGENVAFVWDAGGRLIERRLNTGLRTTQAWFEDGNLKQKKNLYNASTLTSHLYTLDAQGRRATHAENLGGTTKNWTYSYDYLDRLTSASDGTAETYAYDLYGNRRSKTKSGTTTAYLYDAAQQLTEIRSGSDTGALIGATVHDADGHLTKLCEVTTGTITQTSSDCTASGTGATTLALVWNALDHLNSATRIGANAIAESYAYDDQGRRITKTSGASTTQYLYDGEDIHAEWATTMTGMPAAVYVQGVGADDPVLRLTGNTSLPTATQAAYLEDGLGSVVGLASPAGTLTANQRFDAWGNKTTSTGTIQQYGYTGREPDATGLEYYRARYYHPGLGQFASRDPMGMADSISPYAYVANDPVNLVDPMGLLAVDPIVIAQGESSYFGITLTDVGNGLNSVVQGLARLAPGGEAMNNASASFKEGNYGNAVLFGVASILEAGLAVGTGAESVAVKGVVAGQGGRFADLAGKVGDDLTAHHIPQAALKFTTRADGGAVVMTTAEHAATRTFTFKGAATALEDAGKSFRDVLAKDIRDVRSIVGNAYDQGIKDVLQYYRQNFPDLMKKP